MAEKIAGIIMREIDQSQPTRTRPEGIPAGVIGTAAKGPAFVPVLFANTTDFVREFGSSRGGDYFGPIAVAEWMKNAKAGLYLRTLGVGNAEKADSTYGTTENAGFIVGEQMRDKDRTTAGGGNTGDYPEMETDGDVDGLAANPYAGAAVPKVIDQTTVHQALVNAAPAVITLTPAAFTTVDNLDGNYFIVALDDGAGGERKTLFWFSSQSTDEGDPAGARTIDNLVVRDGSLSIDLSSTGADAIKFIDLQDKDNLGGGPVTDLAELLACIAAWIDDAGVDATTAVVGNTVEITGTNNGAVTEPSLNGGGLTSISEAGGADGQPYTALASTLVFEEEILISAGSTIVIDDGEGETATVTFTTEALKGSPVDPAVGEIDLVTYATPEAAVGAAFDYLTGTVGADLSNGGSNVVQTVVSAGVMATQRISVTASKIDEATTGNQLALLIEQNGDASQAASPTVVVTENNPTAPKGRVHFLGCNMFSDGDINAGADNLQDYLDGAYDDTTKTPVLRGVLMFPGGVVPGLAINKDDVEESDVPAAAYEGYGAGQNLGETQGHLESGVFQLILNGYSGDAPKVLKASMNPKSSIYFAKILNTNPEDIQVKGHYLYAHYDIPRGLAVETTDGAAGNDHAFCLPGTHDRNSGSDFSHSNYEPTYEDFREKFSHSSSPWIYSQAMGNGPQKLFKIHSLTAGKIAIQDQFKIEISNVHQPQKGEYGTFNLKLRKLNDLDSDKVEIESYSGLTLDPTSENFIGRKIGDQNTFFDFEKSSAKQKIVTEGLYPNQSRLIRVEIAPQVQSGQMEISALPVGFAGKKHLVVGTGSLEGGLDVIEPPLPFRQKVSKSAGTNLQADSKLCWGLETMSVINVGTTSLNSVYNATTEKNAGLIYNLTKHFPGVGVSPAWVGDNRNAADVNTTQVIDCDRYNNNEFSLERILVRCRDTDVTKTADPAWWHEALYIRNGNTSFYQTDGATLYKESVDSTVSKNNTTGYRYLNPAIDLLNPPNANLKYFKFVVPMEGGFDGLDIFDGDKKRMNNISSVREMSAPSDYGATAGSTTAAFRKGLDILAEKADVDIQLLAIPGLSSSGITDHAIDKTEDRFDALYLMDIPAYDQDDKLFQGIENTHVSVINTAKQLQDRNISSSFAAAYFPNVNMMDPYNPSISVEAPPSCAVLGAMGFNDAVSHPWYAPAGFTRGTLTSVEEGTVIFDKDDLETLHVQDINPITSFANSAYDGMVVWGQKTMLQGKSALDRVNVRRLLIDIRRKVRVVANSILFEPNRESTLAAFSARVNPILVRIQQQQGLDRFKVVIDSSTTTQQDIENNTIRGKIFLQPVKSIEFISLDFVVGNQID